MGFPRGRDQAERDTESSWSTEVPHLPNRVPLTTPSMPVDHPLTLMMTSLDLDLKQLMTTPLLLAAVTIRM